MRMESSVVVNRPIDEVWAYMTNLFNLPRGGGGGRFLRVRQTSPGPVAVGSTFQGRLVLLGFERRLEATTDGTRVTRVSEFEPRPNLKPLWWILVLYLRRSSKARNHEIKRLIEAEHPGGS